MNNLRKVISVLMAMVIVLGTCAVAPKASAATSAIFEIVYDSAGNEDIKQVQEMAPQYVTTGSEEELNTENGYLLAMSTSVNQAVFPINLSKKGTLLYQLGSGAGLNGSTGKIKAQFYSDASCTKSIGDAVLLNVSTQDTFSALTNLAVNAAGKYYLKIMMVDTVPSKTTYSIVISALAFSSEDTALTSKFVASYTGTESRVTYHKVVVKKDSYITTEFENYSTKNGQRTSGEVKTVLCNSKKKAMSKTAIVDVPAEGTGLVTYAVKKGTYYIKVAGNGIYRTKGKVTAVKDQGAHKISKAKKYTIGKTVKGLLLQQDKVSTADYYKFTLKKTKKLSMILKGSCATDGQGIQFAIVNKKGQEVMKTFTAKGNFNISGKTAKKIPAGTYYLKIKKSSAKGSGWYSVKIKK
ncbi:MAG: hypothetical protein K6G65_02210 [Lachnospiraceae bacterium]|nr:hypothetical protein [Lachnospiraceae bacterium]